MLESGGGSSTATSGMLRAEVEGVSRFCFKLVSSLPLFISFVLLLLGFRTLQPDPILIFGWATNARSTYFARIHVSRTSLKPSK